MQILHKRFLQPSAHKCLLRRLLNSLLTLCTAVHVKQKGASHCLHILYVNKCLKKFPRRRKCVVNFSCNIVYETEEKVKQPAAHVSYSSMVLQCVRSVFPDTWCNTSMMCKGRSFRYEAIKKRFYFTFMLNFIDIAILLRSIVYCEKLYKINAKIWVWDHIQ